MWGGRKAADAAQAGAQVLDQVTVPRLLTGDLWTVNTMLAAAPVPTICGVLDIDRTWWGDPEADWTMRMAGAKQDARTAFFDAHGRPAETEAAQWRRHVYVCATSGRCVWSGTGSATRSASRTPTGQWRRSWPHCSDHGHA
ncbi:hypothetical protein ACFV0B_28690 [Streptomyces xanthophaeus]|uniref:hypothetical protein n=1 Tax=Streptomyces xanthophaeus TaxID=67385 RepID=UPI003676AA42